MWGKYCRAGLVTDENIIRRMRFACWVTKAIDTHSEYVILTALPPQQWLCESSSCYDMRTLTGHVALWGRKRNVYTVLARKLKEMTT